MRTLNELREELKLQYEQQFAGSASVSVDACDVLDDEVEGCNVHIVVTVPNQRGGRDTLRQLFADVDVDGEIRLTVSPGY